MISVVICTFNRKKYLVKAIESIKRQTISPELFELIIVDNNSNDGSEQLILNEYKNEPYKIKYIIEKEQGLSFCRNTGYQNATYNYVAYLDDDGIACENWLKNMLTLIDSYRDNGKFAAAGGNVIPIWESPEPWWLLPDLQHYFSVFDLSDEQFILQADSRRTLLGCNIFYSKRVIEMSGGFNTELGRKDRNLVSGEETLLNRKLIREGFKLIYEPSIEIKHHITKSRLKFSWLIRRSFWGGYSHVIMLQMEKSTNFTFSLKLLSGAIYKIFINLLLIPLSFLFKPKNYFVVYFIRAVNGAGQLYGSIKCKSLK